MVSLAHVIDSKYGLFWQSIVASFSLETVVARAIGGGTASLEVRRHGNA